VNVAGQRAGVVDGQMGLVLPGQGYALDLQASLSLPIPGLRGTALMGDVDLAINRTGRALNQSITVGGQEVKVRFARGNVTDFAIRNIDASIEGLLADTLSTLAKEMNRANAYLLADEDLPLIGRSLEDLLQISDELSLGQHVLDYLAQDAAAFGPKAVPTLRGLEAYLRANWQVGSGGADAASGLRFNLDQSGLDIGFTGEVSTAVKGMDLNLEGALGQVGVSVNGVMKVDASFEAALDFDFALDWSSGFAAKLEVRELSFDGSLSAKDVILNANLGPLGLSIGRPDDPTVGGVAGQKWQRGSLDAKLSGELSFVKNQLQVSAPADKNYFNVVLPIYATVAGIDLAADPATAPSVSISAKPFEGQFNVQAKNLDQLANFRKISVADLITALPNMLGYLQTIDVDQL
ncbi:MAG: hypothetical protein ACKO3Q_10660, partial [Betaproteobacteria bacterium]